WKGGVLRGGGGGGVAGGGEHGGDDGNRGLISTYTRVGNGVEAVMEEGDWVASWDGLEGGDPGVGVVLDGGEKWQVLCDSTQRGGDEREIQEERSTIDELQ
ncbi:unnamed protein product, partial [Choristocarpus tenellus]